MYPKPNPDFRGKHQVKVQKGVVGKGGIPQGGADSGGKLLPKTGILPGDGTKPTPSTSPLPTPSPSPSPAPPPTSAGNFRANVKAGMKGMQHTVQNRSAAMDKAKGLLGGSVPSRVQMRLDRNKKRMGNIAPTPTPSPSTY